MKTTPIPVKFDRQGHSCNFFVGFGSTDIEGTAGGGLEGARQCEAHVIDLALRPPPTFCKLTWLALGKDPAACSCRVEQFTAL